MSFLNDGSSRLKFTTSQVWGQQETFFSTNLWVTVQNQFFYVKDKYFKSSFPCIHSLSILKIKTSNCPVWTLGRLKVWESSLLKRAGQGVAVKLNRHHRLQGVIYKPTRCCRRTIASETSVAKCKAFIPTPGGRLEGGTAKRWRRGGFH